jgi:uncharacterized protein YrrD
MARKDTNSSSPIDLHLGATVRASDGHRLGTVGRIIIDRPSRRVTEIVVHEGGFPTREVIVPVEQIGQVRRDVVDLTLTAAELDRLPDFEEEAFLPLGSRDIPPLITWEGPPDYEPRPVIIPAAALYTPKVMPFAPQLVVERHGEGPDSTDLSVGDRLYCREGLLGTIVDLLVSPGSGRAQAVIVESGGSHPLRWEIPVDELRVVEGGDGLQTLRHRWELGRFERRRAA